MRHLGYSMPPTNYKAIRPAWWVHGKDDARWISPETVAFPGASIWLLEGKEMKMSEMSIKVLTKTRTWARMVPPAAEAAWEARLAGEIPWKRIWKIKPSCASPRDEVTWLKVQHRNLWVANRDPSLASSKCSADGCSEDESMKHLVSCRHIQNGFWRPVKELMKKLGMRAVEDDAFLLLGRINATKAVDKEEATMLFIACAASIRRWYERRRSPPWRKLTRDTSLW